MNIVFAQFASWDKIHSFNVFDIKLKQGDFIIAKTKLGIEIGLVVGLKNVNLDHGNQHELECKNTKKDGLIDSDKSIEENNLEVNSIIRKATFSDKEKLYNKKEKKEAIEYCKNLVNKHGLRMKIVDVYFMFDESRITFAFIADGRIDFRELVKDLVRHFNKTVRLYQIGIRDEARIMGDCGHCGRELCCKCFLNNLNSITSEMAERQQVSHRGSERISGMCGRLMCCLSYEDKGYAELYQNMPAIGTKVNVDGRHGVIVGHHVLKQSVNVKFPSKNGEDGGIIEIDLNRNKK